MREIIGVIGADKTCALAKVELPEPLENQIQIKVAYAGVNRADVEQSLGLYPAPLGASHVLGLECSGIVEKIGNAVREFKIGDRVMALLTGGGFGTYVNADADTVLAVPPYLNLLEASIIPESLFTFWANAVMDGGLQAGKTFLVHGGASGLGSFSIQLAKAMGCQCFSTARGTERVSFVEMLGADKVVNTDGLSEAQVCEKMLNLFGESSVDVVMDHLGAQFLDAHFKTLKPQGRIIFINAVSGENGPLDYDLLIGKRIHMIGSVLRGRSVGEKKLICNSILSSALPILTQKTIKPHVDSEVTLSNFSKAFLKIKDRENMGKITLAVNSV